MTKEAILHYFALDRGAKVTLREQLQHKLELFIESSLPDTPLPTEQQLQDALSVSRVTVRNAIIPLYKEGLVVRCAGRGTRTSKGTRASQKSSTMRIHQMALGHLELPRPKTLSLALYENIPAQKSFWEYTVNSFNALYPQIRLDIQWIPLEVSDSAYKAYLQEVRPDLFQREPRMTLEGVASPLPDSMKSFVLEDRDLQPGDTDVSLTYGYSTQQTYWNADLANEFGLVNVQQRLASGGYYELVAEALDRLPADYQVSGHVWDFFAPTVEGADLQELNADQLRKTLTTLQHTGRSLRAFTTSQQDPYDSVRNFAAGRQLFLTTVPSALQAFGAHLSFDCKSLPIVLEAGGKLGCIPLRLSISKGTEYVREALLFLQHMLSESIQGQLILRRNMHPVRRSVWRHLAPVHYGLSEEESLRVRSQLSPETDGKLHNFLIFAIRDDLADLLVHGVSVSIVHEQIMAKWRQLQAIK